MEVSILSTAEQTFLLIPIKQKRQPVFLSLHLDVVRIELHSHMLLQEPKCYIPLESAVVYSLRPAVICVIRSYRLIDGFGLPVENEL